MRNAFQRSAIAAAMLLSIPTFLSAQKPALFVLHVGTAIPLTTAQHLSSKTNVKGDMVALKTAADVLVDGHVVIAKGTAATGQVSDAQAKGAMGMSGKLAIRPLYIRVGDDFVRLGGASSTRASVTAGAVVGLAVLTPGFTGRSAVIPEGTPVEAFVEHEIELPEVIGG